MTQKLETSIVIPAFNEAQRIAATLEQLVSEIASQSLAPVSVYEVIVVDDGSADETVKMIQAFSKRLPRLQIIQSVKNSGKGHAVRQGFKRAQAPWILMADADMSTPWTEVTKLAKVCQQERAQVAIGSRDIVGSVIKQHQSFIRENLGKSFNVFIRALTDLPYKDTQCGFKFIERASIAGILPRLSVDGFAWDVELLMLARAAGLRVAEVAVVWEHKDDSRVRVFRDGFRMLGSVLKLRVKQLPLMK